MREDDMVRLRHMLDAAHEATGFAQGRARTDLDSDRKLVLALVKAVEIIGEAASQLAQTARDEAPDIPWEDIIGMRHRLVHALGGRATDNLEKMKAAGAHLPILVFHTAGDDDDLAIRMLRRGASICIPVQQCQRAGRRHPQGRRRKKTHQQPHRGKTGLRSGSLRPKTLSSQTLGSRTPGDVHDRRRQDRAGNRRRSEPQLQNHRHLTGPGLRENEHAYGQRNRPLRGFQGADLILP